MKIVHIVEPFASGVAVFVRQLVENMPQDQHLIIHGERPSISSAAEVKKTFSTKNVKFIRWHFAQRNIDFIRDFLALYVLYRMLKKLKQKNMVDAVHLHSSKSGFLGRLACRLVSIRNVIYTPNGAPFLSKEKSLTGKVYKILERLADALGGKVVCCSPSEQQVYLSLGIRAMNINNGIAMDDSHTDSTTLAKTNRFRIVNCARITDQKNPQLFNEIARQFEGIDQFEFVWVGDGEERNTLDSSNIIISGWLPEEKAKEIVSNADVYLSTSAFEGLSFAVLEALVFKKPVLLTNCIGNKDVVKKGLNGDLYENTKDAVVKLMQYFNNRKMLKLMGEYSQRYCKQAFNITTTCLSYRNLYTGNT
jgi:glycosyltransferase involved in cell wall biosynthesis